MDHVNVKALISNIGLKNKIIVSERNDPRAYGKIHFVITQLLYQLSYKIVVQTNECGKLFWNCLKKKVMVIPNPVMKPSIKPYSGLREKKIVAVGRLTSQKNYPLMLEAFYDFSKIHNDYILEIYGMGDQENQIRKMIKDLNLQNRVFLRGYVNDVSKYIYNATAFIQTSDYEGISNAMIESMALGIPTICTDCPIGGARAMISNRKNGILIPINNKQKLIDSMNLLLEDKKLAEYISLNSSNIVKKYSIDKIYKMWREITK